MLRKLRKVKPATLPGVSARKLERLVNLTMLLLSTRRPLTVDQIRELVPSYDQNDSESFRRMFERDKEELRELGIPLETESLDGWGMDSGYRIRRTDYELPDIALEPDEAAALGLAARLWQSAELAEASQTALLKLRAAGIEAQPVAPQLDPRIEAAGPAFEPCLAAARAREAVRFGYRRPGDAAVSQRTLEPWGVVHRHGRWYAVGHDRDRSAVRVFRLSRVTGPVEVVGPATLTRPPGVDLLAEVSRLDSDPPVETASVRVAPDTAWELRRRGTPAGTDDAAGWDRYDVPFGDLERFAEWVVGFGADVVVDGPARAREAVVARLRAVVGGVPA
jgi:predicted DNA-binding transcriptional regulator YafY